jgi:hypothetical protein
VLDYSEEDIILPKSSRKRIHLVSDDEESDATSSIATSSIATSSIATSSKYQKLKVNLPEVVGKKGKEAPLPHPFPLPSNYRPEVELCLRSKKMTAVALFSAVASAIFSFKRLLI